MKQHTRLLAGTFFALLCATCGCTPKYVNKPLETFDPQAGYRLANLKPTEQNTDSTFVMLTFSGGGTRAAALAYGVLLGLRDIELPVGPGQSPRTLLDEVDAISSVSGGSFTALGYGLWGQDLFDGHFETRFLRHNVQGDLVLRGLNPLNVGANKSELAARYYDQHVFKHATYQDLLDRGCRPLINVNAADMARQEQFRFLQKDFDLLGSDLSKLPLAWAAASSSAFPILLDPLRFKYFHGEPMVAAIRNELTSESLLTHPGYHLWALDLIDAEVFERSGDVHLDKRNHQYLHLLDGGIVDNLGLMAFLENVKDGVVKKLLDSGNLDRVVVVIVDAGTAQPRHIERSSSTPGGLASGVTTATSGIHTGTWFQKAVLKYLFVDAYPEMRRAYDLCAAGVQDIPPPYNADFYVADLSFASLKDRAQRRRFLTLPTSFALDEQDVDALIAVGQQLVKENPELQRLLQDLRGLQAPD